VTAGTASLVVGDVWALKGAVPNRFAANLTFAAPSPMGDRIFRLVGSGATTEPQIMPAGRDGNLVGSPLVPWSFNAGTSVATGSTIALAGDFSQYAVVDRIGITAELIPHLFSGNTVGSFGFPVGQRGLYTYGRTGGGVLVPNAFRALVGR
jgi:predicted phage gp36 major capsid-like protein